MLFTEVLNSRLNFFQLEKHDTTQLDKQMMKDITDTSHIGQSSQHTRSDPTKLQQKKNQTWTAISIVLPFSLFARQVYINKLNSL